MFERIFKHLLRAIPIALIISAVTAFAALAQDGVSPDEVAYALDNFLLFIAAVLVLFMQAGFALVEVGFNESKNSVNILFKNTIDMCLGVLLYFLIGYGLMYPGDFNGYLGFSGSGVSSEAAALASPYERTLYPQVDFLFQVAFAATAATIVSGAVAGRLKFGAYLVYTAFITGLVYPISGSWQWGGGWLAQMGFVDFAGSLLVHAVGGFAGLAGAIMLGPRIGKFNKDGSANEMPYSSFPLATLGVFVLLIGWFGFNPGSQLALYGQANTEAVMLIATNTLIAAAVGGLAGMIVSWVTEGKPKLGITLNGILAGLVGITANCHAVTNVEAIIIGAVAGVLVFAGMKLLDVLKIDDPVGAWPVHGLNGIWGGIAMGIFGTGANLGVQVFGSVVIAAWSFVLMLALFGILKAINFLRISEAEEMEGLDIGEHGEASYTIPAAGTGGMPAHVAAD